MFQFRQMHSKTPRFRTECYEKLKDKFWNRFNQKDPASHGWYYRSVGDALSGSDSLRETSAFREYAERVEAVFGVCKGKP